MSWVMTSKYANNPPRLDLYIGSLQVAQVKIYDSTGRGKWRWSLIYMVEGGIESEPGFLKMSHALRRMHERLNSPPPPDAVNDVADTEDES